MLSPPKKKKLDLKLNEGSLVPPMEDGDSQEWYPGDVY